MYLIAHLRHGRIDDPEFETPDLGFAAAIDGSKDGKAWGVRGDPHALGGDGLALIGIVYGGKVYYDKREFDRLSAELEALKVRLEKSKADHERTIQMVEDYYDDSNR